MRATAADRPPLGGQRVLFVVPVTPAFTGNGLAMRAASLLAAMQGEGASVRLVIIPAYEPRDLELSPEVAILCLSWSRVPAPRPAWWSWMEDRWRDSNVNPFWPGPAHARWRRRVKRVLSESTEALLVAFRLSALSFLFRRRIAQVPCWLDLDELDSGGLRRQAALAAAEGHADAGLRLEQDAVLAEKLERKLLGRPQWLSVASEEERRQLPESVRARAFVLPNTVRSRPVLPLRESHGGPFRCLFVGSFGYHPNVDAVAWFCADILPRLREKCGCPVEFLVAGPDLGRRLSYLAPAPDVRILGWVDDLAPVYREADIVVAPLRTGAGTRIKILEAFSFGRAVVSTPIGAEGLLVKSGRELMLAPEGESFAQACATLLANVGERRRLAAQARVYVEREHGPEAVRRSLRGTS
jgi:glycosyltransferase involved in cell wall biosynthesis